MIYKPLLVLCTVISTTMCGSQLAVGQTNGSYLIEVSGEVSPANPIVNIDIWGAWDQPGAGDFVLIDTDFDVIAGDGQWLSATLNPVSFVGEPGTVVGSTVLGVHFIQIHIPQIGLHGDPAEPIFMWRGEWTTTDFSPRSVPLFTQNTTTFLLIARDGSSLAELYPLEFTAGGGLINVVPAPHAGACLLAGLALATGRRRRSRAG